MGRRVVMRFVDWVLRMDVSGTLPIFEMQCTTCGESSGAVEDPGPPQEWALQHAGKRAHTGFRGVNTTYFRAEHADECEPSP
ncbi:hypothetical protein ACFP1Z_02175 [Streptomyces gamaensis]|uniref:DUF7848 domain-containing protein n=1 Tax=Streptomyces gamaensis TaxID=1763542 RepID=A0ABW0YUA6_9ACTN